MAKSKSNSDWKQPRKVKEIRVSPEYHLIITEGTKTEPQYFGAIKEIINNKYKEKIQLEVLGIGKNTIQILEEAIKKVKENPNIYKHAWIVYDTDDFVVDNINKVVQECKNASNEDTTYHAIWSNQCIELWFLLHFSFFQADIHRKDYFPKLTKILNNMGKGNYEKNREDIYEILKPYTSQAILNAEKLEILNQGKSPADSAPGTMVHTLVKRLQPYL